MSPQRRTALVSVAAACVLIAIKVGSGASSGSLGLLAEAVHSGTDLVAALLTLFAVGYAARPADAGHQYGHGKAEHLAALAEAGGLLLVSVAIGVVAVLRLVGTLDHEVQAAWWAFAAAAAVIAIDVSRVVVSTRAARKHSSAALLANAYHFGSDLIGTLAVVAGLVAVRAGWQQGDALAALFVAALVVLAATRLMQRNVDVLMDRAPSRDLAAARTAIATLDPPVELRRLRLRQAGGRSFADVVIGVAPGAAVGQGHAAADRVEAAVEQALPGSDIVVHVEPGAATGGLRERVRAAAMTVSHVREIHDLVLLEMGDDRIQASLHLKLPGDLALGDAHAIAEQVESAILRDVPEVRDVQSHLEPLAREAPGRAVEDPNVEIEALVAAAVGEPPRAIRVLHTAEGLVVLLTVALPPDIRLEDAHEHAGAVTARVRAALPGVADVVVHTEP